MPVLLASFFQRLEGMEAINRLILSHARISALLTFRGDPLKTVLMDFTQTPARILVDGEQRGGTIQMAARGEIMHDVLLDRMPPGVAMSRREMLLRGSAADLSKFIPLFEFSPMLYREHLTDLGLFGYRRPGAQPPRKEDAMNPKTSPQGVSIPPVRLTTLEKITFFMTNTLSYALGYVMGVMRYRLFRNMNLFQVLSSMSRGLAAASPKEDASMSRKDTES
jgi:hypothetical protein